MKLLKNLVGYSLIFVIFIITIITFLRSHGEINSSFYNAFLIAGIITTINFNLGVLSIKLGLKKTINSFLILFLGGMVIRLFLMLISVFICLKFLELKGNNFIFSVFIFYVFYQIIEIFYVIYRNK
jgi:hypothetical protein